LRAFGEIHNKAIAPRKKIEKNVRSWSSLALGSLGTKPTALWAATRAERNLKNETVQGLLVPKQRFWIFTKTPFSNTDRQRQIFNGQKFHAGRK